MRIIGIDGEMVQCPECRSTDLRYTQSFHWADFFMYLRKKHGLRCRNCGGRFYERTDESKNVMWLDR